MSVNNGVAMASESVAMVRILGAILGQVYRTFRSPFTIRPTV